MDCRIARICRYPVKGLNEESLEQVELAAGEGLPHDRRFAIAHGSTRFDPAAPEWLPKTQFLMLMRDEKLAQLRCRFDPEEGVLAIDRKERTVVRAKITEQTGRMVAEQFFASFMSGALRGSPRILEAEGHMFSDVKRKMVSIINLATVSDLERVIRQPVDPLRFRGNLYLEGLEPWAEFDWIGRDLKIGGATLRVEERISRCAATNVNPGTAERDLNIPLALQRGYGHGDLGVYASVVEGGGLSVGDAVKAAAPA